MSSKKKSKSNPPEPHYPGQPPRPGDNEAGSQQNYHRPQQQSAQRQLTHDRLPRINQHGSHQKPATLIPKILKSRIVQLGIVLLIALLPSLYFYNASRIAEQQSANPDNSKLQTTAEVVKRVNQHILLPSGEQPTVATVSDASKVRGQTFFANAASGDKVLIYAQAKKAYLYRPSIDRIIEVAPLAPNLTSPE